MSQISDAQDSLNKIIRNTVHVKQMDKLINPIKIQTGSTLMHRLDSFFPYDT